ncbi:MAG: hypothetical protein P1U42_10320 [Phycisphaerales bacterium]|nr:hypothetical protein [Phycisphaerales bacterium]
MEDASQTMARGEYLSAALSCKEALLVARQHNDFDRMKRICLPMLESQRYIRQEALDSNIIYSIESSKDIPEDPGPACYLFAPNFVGADARRFRSAANDAGIGAFVLTREPITSRGECPIVGVAERVVRIRVIPPKDNILTANWFSHAAEALGDQAINDAINASDPDDPKQWIVDDFLDRIDACPEHEKFIKALSDACDDAINAPPTPRKRRRGIINDPYSF